MKKKKKLILIFVILIILLIIIGVAVNVLRKEQNEYDYNIMGITSDIDSNTTDRDRTEKGQLLFSGMGVFADKYDGDFKVSEITDELNKIVTSRIPKTYEMVKNYNSTELQEFYNNNQKNLQTMYGIQDSEQFVNFATKLQKQNKDFEQYYMINVLKDTFALNSDVEGYSYVECEVEYENGAKMILTFYLSNLKSTIPNFIVNIK